MVLWGGANSQLFANGRNGCLEPFWLADGKNLRCGGAIQSEGGRQTKRQLLGAL